MYIKQVKPISIVLPVLLMVQSWFPYISGHKFGSVHLSDGALKLIIKTYINDLVSTYQPDDSLSNRLHQLSDHVANHPALHQKRLYVGPEPPTHDPELGDEQHHQLAEGQSNLVAKRKTMKEEGPSEQFPSEEICPTNRQWEQLNKTHDLYDNEVEVMQAEGMTQFIYTYRCSSNKASSCVGISPLYNSECTERNGWVYMFYKKPEDEAPQWGYVAAPHHCACKIQPKIEATVPTTE